MIKLQDLKPDKFYLVSLRHSGGVYYNVWRGDVLRDIPNWRETILKELDAREDISLEELDKLCELYNDRF